MKENVSQRNVHLVALFDIKLFIDSAKKSFLIRLLYGYLKIKEFSM